METLNNPLLKLSNVNGLLKKYGLKADKSFGQNFLIDAAVLQAIVNAVALDDESNVLEIGPGLGVLTYELVQRAKQVTSLELDARLFPLLEESLAKPENLDIIHTDALKYDFSTVPANSYFAANLPYNVATPIIGKALESGRFKRLVFLVQREVAERLAAPPNSKTFGALSLVTQYFAKVKVVRHVKGTAFMPPPAVESSVVRLDRLEGIEPNPELFEFIFTGFKHRRKTLKKNLLMAGFDKDKVIGALGQVGVEELARAESLPLETFKQLFSLLRT